MDLEVPYDPTVDKLKDAKVRATARYDIDASFYEMRFRVNYLPKMNLASSSRHWSYYRSVAAAWRKLLVQQLNGYQPIKPLQHAAITLCRHSVITPDYDNVSYSFKPIVDALALSDKNVYKSKETWIERCNIIANDDIVHLRRRYLWRKALGRSQQGITVLVQSIPLPPPNHEPKWEALVPRS